MKFNPIEWLAENTKAHKSYRHLNVMLFIDETIKMKQIRKACPKFFSGKYFLRKFKLFRGHLFEIMRDVEWVYAFDVRTQKLVSLGNFLHDGQKYVNGKMDTPEPHPLKMSVGRDRINVPIQAEYVVFRDEKGRPVCVESPEITRVNDDDATPEDTSQLIHDYVSQVIKREYKISS